MKRFLISKLSQYGVCVAYHGLFPAQFRYKEEDMVILTDDARNPRQIPTQENIVGSFLTELH